MVALNGLVWTVYGIIVRNWIPLVLANSIGVVSGVASLVTFRSYAKDSFSGKLLSSLTAATFLVFGAMQHVVLDPTLYPTTQDFYGKFCVSITIAMYASPLVAVREVLRTGSTSALSKIMTLASFCCSSLWFAYGVVVDDVYIWFPNVAGVCLSLLQVGLFLSYPRHVHQHHHHHRGNGAGLA